MNVNRRSFLAGLLTTTVIGPARAAPKLGCWEPLHIAKELCAVQPISEKLFIDIYIKPKVAVQYITLNTIIDKAHDDIFKALECDFCVS